LLGAVASLGLGLVWGLWHLPLFLIDGTAQAHIPPALFLLSVVAMSVVFAWLVNRTAGSVMAVLVLHTATNFWPSVVPVLPTEASYRAYAFVVALLVLLALVLLATGLMIGLPARRIACSRRREEMCTLFAPEVLVTNPKRTKPCAGGTEAPVSRPAGGGSCERRQSRYASAQIKAARAPKLGAHY